MNLTRAEQIQGWMISSELEWLAQQASTRARIVEVGAWMGRSTRAMAENTFGMVYAVDTFTGSAEHEEFLKDKPDGWLFDQFMENVRDLTNIQAYQMTSLEAAKSCAEDGLEFDMVFLDAAHDFKSVQEDIWAWLPLVAPGGMLCGHDLGPNWPEVELAVRGIIPDFKMGPNQIWWKI